MRYRPARMVPGGNRSGCGVSGDALNDGFRQVVLQEGFDLFSQFGVAGTRPIQKRGHLPRLQLAGIQEDLLDVLVASAFMGCLSR